MANNNQTNISTDDSQQLLAISTDKTRLLKCSEYSPLSLVLEKTPWLVSALQKGLIFIIHCYRYTIGGLLGPCCCRFEPTCSLYAVKAITQHGPIKGILLSLKRLLSCHPWHHGGFNLP